MADTRQLGFWPLLGLGLNGIVGVGIFFAPKEVAAVWPGAGGALAFVITPILLLPVAAAYGLLGSRFLEDGGPYVWARAAFGERAAFAVGWVSYVSSLFSLATILAGAGHYLGPSVGAVGNVNERLFALVVAALLAGLAGGGLRPSAALWSLATVLKLAPLALLVVFGLPGAHVVADAPAVGSRWRALLVVVFALQGFEIVPVLAGKARAGTSVVALATLGSLLGAAVLYVALHWVCLARVPSLATSSAPLVDAARALGQPLLVRAVAAGTYVSSLGIAFGMVAMTPRYLAVLARALRAPGLERERRGVPLRSLVITWLAVSVGVALGDLSQLFALSSLSVLLQYAVSVLALIVLALRRAEGLRPAHALLGVPALHALGLLGTGATLGELGVAGGLVVVGFVLRWIRVATGPETRQ